MSAWTALLFLVSLWASCLHAISNAPENLIFGAEYMGLGIDASTTDELFRYKQQIFQLTIDGARPNTFVHSMDPRKSVRAVPEEINVRTIGSTTSSSDIHESLDDLRLSLSTSLGLTYGSGSMSGSVKLSAMMAMEQGKSYKYLVNQADTKLYQLIFAKRTVKPAFQANLAKLKQWTYSQNPNLYKAFFQSFGTHFIDTVLCGGSIRQTTRVEAANSDILAEMALYVALKFQAGGKGMALDMKLGFSIDARQADSTSISSAEIVGGVGAYEDFLATAGEESTAAEMFNKWTDSLFLVPAAINIQVKEIWRAARDNDLRVEICKGALIFLGVSKDASYCKSEVAALSALEAGG